MLDDKQLGLLCDIWDSAKAIVQYTNGVTREAFMANSEKQDAVLRRFEIIGEALNRIDRLDPPTAARIAELRRIVDFRNRIIHGYDTVDDATVWGIIEGHLPTLLEQTEALLSEGNDEG